MNPFIKTLAAALFIVAAGHAAAQSKAPDTAAQELIGYAAADFKQHSSVLPRQFRHVKLGQLRAEDGRHRLVLCGEFLAEDTKKPRWTPFVTIKTDPYEQWLGGQSRSFCSGPGFKLLGKQDLSAELKRQTTAP